MHTFRNISHRLNLWRVFLHLLTVFLYQTSLDFNRSGTKVCHQEEHQILVLRNNYISFPLNKPGTTHFCFIIISHFCVSYVCCLFDKFHGFNPTRHWKQTEIIFPIEVCWLLPVDTLYTLNIPQEGEEGKMSRPCYTMQWTFRKYCASNFVAALCVRHFIVSTQCPYTQSLICALLCERTYTLLSTWFITSVT